MGVTLHTTPQMLHTEDNFSPTISDHIGVEATCTGTSVVLTKLAGVFFQKSLMCCSVAIQFLNPVLKNGLIRSKGQIKNMTALC